MLTDVQLHMLRRVEDSGKLELEAIQNGDHRYIVRLSMEGYVRFHGSRIRNTGHYCLTMKGWQALGK